MIFVFSKWTRNMFYGGLTSLFITTILCVNFFFAKQRFYSFGCPNCGNYNEDYLVHTKMKRLWSRLNPFFQSQEECDERKQMKYTGHRIVNGRLVAKSCMQRPWIMLARIKGKDHQEFHCGASIINRVALLKSGPETKGSLHSGLSSRLLTVTAPSSSRRWNVSLMTRCEALSWRADTQHGSTPLRIRG